MRFLFASIFIGLVPLNIASCCGQEVCSEQSESSFTYMPSTSSGCEECGGGGTGGSLTNSSEVTSTISSTGAWGNSCHWCNGPGCEAPDEACVSVESGSRSVVCRDIDSEPEAGCFTTVDLDSRRVLCCCEPGICPGVW